MEINIDEGMLSVAKVAEILHVSRKTVYQMIRTGELRAFKVTKRRTAPWRVPKDELKRFVSKSLSGGTASEQEKPSEAQEAPEFLG